MKYMYIEIIPKWKFPKNPLMGLFWMLLTLRGVPDICLLLYRPQILVLMKLSEDYTPKYPKMVTFAAQLKAGQLQGFVSPVKLSGT